MKKPVFVRPLKMDMNDHYSTAELYSVFQNMGFDSRHQFLYASAKLVKTSVPNVTAVGSMPTFTVSNEVLTITAGAVPTLGTAIDVATGSLANDGTGDTVVISVSAN